MLQQEVTRNEEDDVEPGFVAKQKARRADFAALGDDVDNDRARIDV